MTFTQVTPLQASLYAWTQISWEETHMPSLGSAVTHISEEGRGHWVLSDTERKGSPPFLLLFLLLLLIGSVHAFYNNKN